MDTESRRHGAAVERAARKATCRPAHCLHRAALLLSTLCLSLAGIGCGGPVPASSAALLTNGQAAYEHGDDKAAVALTDRFLQAFPGAQEAGEAYYIRGLARCRQGDPAGGEQDFRQAILLTRRPELAGRARLAIGLLAEGRGDQAGAAAAYLTALDGLSLVERPSDQVLFRLGVLLQRQGQWEQADGRFDRLLYLFPQSPYATQASQRIRARLWTIQAGVSADRRAAIAQARELSSAGLAARVAMICPEPLLYAVQVDRYDTCAQAEANLPAVQKVRPNAIVVTARSAPDGAQP